MVHHSVYFVTSKRRQNCVELVKMYSRLSKTFREDQRFLRHYWGFLCNSKIHFSIFGARKIIGKRGRWPTGGFAVYLGTSWPSLFFQYIKAIYDFWNMVEREMLKETTLPIALPYTITLHLHFYYRYFSPSSLNYPPRLSVTVLRRYVSNNRTGK